MSGPLLTADAGQRAVIAERARTSCVVFRDHPLSSHLRPDNADLGVEAGPGGVSLLIQLGVEYAGSDQELREWLTSGTRTFGDIDEALDWLHLHLGRASAYGPSSTDGHRDGDGAPSRQTDLGATPVPALPPASEVTDLDKVSEPASRRVDEDGLFAALAHEVLGQDRALRQLARLAARHTAKAFPRRPTSALLVGPTGVGKTLAAEQLALALSRPGGDEWSYLRLDMNEFSERHSVSRLFGSPPGYIGYGDGRDVAAHLRRHPRTVLLFDEIDKAHPQIWLSLMNLMDAGRLAGQSGEVDARRSILLFTSNNHAGAYEAVYRQARARGGGRAPDPTAEAFEQADTLRQLLGEHGFAPEVVARISAIAVFDSLSGPVRLRLVVHTLQRVVASYGLDLRYVEPAVVSAVLADMPPSERGVRDLEYHLDERYGDRLASYVHSGAGKSVRIVEAAPEVRPAA